MPKLIPTDGDAVIFMKVGRHAGETLEEIVQRKMDEHRAAGQIFWGYGGGTMHPLSKVQPFVKSRLKDDGRVIFVMEPMNSNHPDSEIFAKQYSDDGVNWRDVPEGIRVRGSRYALVLDEIVPEEFEIDLADYRVGIGPSEGRAGDEYIKGRVDKGLFTYAGKANVEGGKGIRRIGLVAALKEPYAVLLSNESRETCSGVG